MIQHKCVIEFNSVFIVSLAQIVYTLFPPQIYPFLGRIWCSVCPFMIFGELTQRWQVARGVVLRKWPHAQGKPDLLYDFHISAGTCALMGLSSALD